MTEERCPNGHFYNPSKFSSCPHCGVSGIDLGPTVPVTAPVNHRGAGPAMVAPTVPIRVGGMAPTVPIQETRTAPMGGWGGPGSGEQATVGYYPSHSSTQGAAHGAVNPVVGWLVCTAGPDRGRDFRIKAEKNFIGRATSMDICISGDPRVSRENHAVVAFEPRYAEFRLYPGDARGLVYLNGGLVDTPTVLHAYDKVELGDSHLLFVPFCGERFKWADK